MKSTETSFPLNAWYAAAYDVEVGRSLLARTICKQKLVLYRRQDGQAVALQDACWHRLLPLSLGRLEGDDVVCGYHGLVYNPQGQCVRMPSLQALNPAACVRHYPLVEKHRFIWLWMGDPALADPALVPDMHWNHDPEWAADGKLINVKCDYRLVIDNLMDLTHETYVHGSSIGNEAVVEAPFEVTHDAQHVTVTRWMENIEAPPFWASQIQQARQYKGLVDRWQIIRFEAPCTVTIDVGVAVAGSGAVPHEGRPGDRSQGVNGFVLNTITPETDGSCHYFWAFARNYRIGEQAVTHQLREGVTRIFREDEAVLEAQQQAMDDHPDMAFHNLNIDAGAVRARRLIDARIAQERPPHTVIPIQEAA
jgi:vanillate O-demethylase monooxygenase subunit